MDDAASAGVTPHRRIAIAAVVLGAVLLVVATTMRQMWSFTWTLFLDFTPMSLLLIVSSAALIARPRNLAAWALFGIAFTSVVENFGYAYGLYPTGMTSGDLPFAYPAVLMALALQSAKWIFIPLLFLAFPSGSLTRWRAVVAVTAIAVPLTVTLLVLFNPSAPYGPLEAAWRSVTRELGLLEVFRVAWMGFQSAMVVMILWVFLQARNSSVVVRQQAKWLAVGIVPLLSLEAVIAVFDPEIPTVPNFMLHLVVRTFASMAVAISITKYRLFDVDRFISRTVLYGSMAVAIALAYALIVGLVSAVVGDSSPSQTLSMMAAIGAALSLLPLQSKLRHMANVLVFGHRATPYESMSHFSRALGRSLHADQVLPAIVQAVSQGTGTAWVRATVRSTHGDRVEVLGETPSGTSESIDVSIGDEVVGRIEVAKGNDDIFTPIEIELLKDLAAQAGPAFRNVALTLELERRLDEITQQAADIRSSRERIVVAQDQERRRIERDLHDGVQQNLVSLAGQLRLLTRLLESRPEEAKRLAEQLAREAMDALDEIRDLARGVFPQVITDAGLVAALRAHLAKVRGRVDLVVDQNGEARRFDPRIEIAVYFCCLEALQNVAKHANGAPAVLSLNVAGDSLVFTVADQGPGFDRERVTPGVGMASMQDRLAALGGHLEVSSVSGDGTVVTGIVPLGVTAPSEDYSFVDAEE